MLFFYQAFSGGDESILSGIVHNLGIVFARDAFSVPPASNSSGIILSLVFWLGVFLDVPALPSTLGLHCAPASQRAFLYHLYLSPKRCLFLVLSCRDTVMRDKKGFFLFSLIFRQGLCPWSLGVRLSQLFYLFSNDRKFLIIWFLPLVTSGFCSLWKNGLGWVLVLSLQLWQLPFSKPELPRKDFSARLPCPQYFSCTPREVIMLRLQVCYSQCSIFAWEPALKFQQCVKIVLEFVLPALYIDVIYTPCHR